jgi:hypothetical protein
MQPSRIHEPTTTIPWRRIAVRHKATLLALYEQYDIAPGTLLHEALEIGLASLVRELPEDHYEKTRALRRIHGPHVYCQRCRSDITTQHRHGGAQAYCCLCWGGSTPGRPCPEAVRYSRAEWGRRLESIDQIREEFHRRLDAITA